MYFEIHILPTRATTRGVFFSPEKNFVYYNPPSEVKYNMFL